MALLIECYPIFLKVSSIIKINVMRILLCELYFFYKQ